jgi:hypothetical protein
VICDAGNEAAAETGVGGAVSTTQSTASRFALSIGYRWLDSYRHFVGDVENKSRLILHNQRENKIHTFDLGLSYQLNPRWTLSASAPVIDGTRIAWAGLNSAGVPNPRLVTHARGIGDLTLGAAVWLFRPPPENHFNIQVGFGLKLPTGRDGTTNNRSVTGALVTPSAVDQSIQLGDGGWGFNLSYTLYKSIRRFTFYTNGKYLFNPRNTNGVLTGRSNRYETIMSVSDQYLWQAGIGYAVPKLRGLAFTVSSRMDGVPARDIIGREDGFRRPGYAVSLGPGVQYMRGKDMWSLNVGIAVRRDRTRSIADIRTGVNAAGVPVHGDAAFADSVFMAGYSRSF